MKTQSIKDWLALQPVVLTNAQQEEIKGGDDPVNIIVIEDVDGG
ncbi:MAG: hypothetical protein DHS20C18_02340 [Saprospiraceae bacterium]|nr:MAG: hypothetical protein DHS20C18_02340 [Saprospiraceae bacterium]